MSLGFFMCGRALSRASRKPVRLRVRVWSCLVSRSRHWRVQSLPPRLRVETGIVIG
jgi:hypothetical protein